MRRERSLRSAARSAAHLPRATQRANVPFPLTQSLRRREMSSTFVRSSQPAHSHVSPTCGKGAAASSGKITRTLSEPAELANDAQRTPSAPRVKRTPLSTHNSRTNGRPQPRICASSKISFLDCAAKSATAKPIANAKTNRETRDANARHATKEATAANAASGQRGERIDAPKAHASPSARDAQSASHSNPCAIDRLLFTESSYHISQKEK